MKKRIALVIIIFILLLATIIYILHPKTLPINKIEIYSNIDQTELTKIKSIVTPLTNKNFFTININTIKAHLQKINGIEKINVQKKWPNKLLIYVDYTYPVAILNDKFFLNNFAETYLIKNSTCQNKLPKLYGNKKDSILMIRNLNQITNILSKINIKITSINCENSFNWIINCENGMKIHLDIGYNLTRLQQFVKVYNKIINSNHKCPNNVDLRYNDGLAVAWN